MATKYSILERKNVNGKKKDVSLMESFRLDEVVKYLAEMLNGGES